jgi:thiol-disulfide isomerase/thioredoxin
VRAPVDHIPAPAFPAKLPWINVASLRMDQQRGHPVLVEFWDFCRPNSIRTLPYLKAWHARYASEGLRVVGVHSAGFEPSADPENVAAAVARLGIEYPVVVDVDLEIWQEYENLGWPARYRREPAVRVPLRRGRLRGDRARDPGAARGRLRARRAAPPRG